MRRLGVLLPAGPERRVLGRFYLSCVVSELLNLVLPFQFVFLLLALDRPEWAAIPFVVESLVVFALEIPTGVVADRWGRKRSVVLGELLSGVGWLMVPAVAVVHGPQQLVLACAAFGLEGLGRTLVSGAEEAWVLDNLAATGDERLTSRYFARERSLSSLAGVVSGVVVWTLLLSVPVDLTLLTGLWLVAALGQVLSGAILAATPELAPPGGRTPAALAARVAPVGPTPSAGVGLFPGALGALPDEAREPGDVPRLAELRALLHLKPLVAFAGVVVIAAFAWSVFEDAFAVAFLSRGLNPRELAPLGIAADLIGFVAPLASLVLARRLGPHRALASLLLLGAASSCLLLVGGTLWGVLCLYLGFQVLDHAAGPVASTILQAYIPARVRATASSITNQARELAVTLGFGVFALMLGQHGEELQRAMPGLVEAFRGQPAAAPEVPAGLFGLPVAEGVIVVFALMGALGAVLLLAFPWRRHAGADASVLAFSGADDV